MRWYAAAFLILVAAQFLGLGLVSYLLYVFVAGLLVSRYLARQWSEGLTAERAANRLSAEVGERIAVEVTIRNCGRWAVPWVLLEDILPRQALVQRPPRLRVQGRRLALRSLARDATAILGYTLHCQMRGYYQLGPLCLETGDLFGLHRRWRVVTEPHYLLVYPRIIPIHGYDLASRRPVGEVRMTYRLFEDPTRQAGVRDYRAGDPLRRIHWRATARTGTLQSKLYEPSSVAGATIVLDFHRQSYLARYEPLRSELAITTVASLAHALYLLDQQVGLATNGRDAADRIRQEGWQGDFRTRRDARRMASMRATSTRLEPVIVPTLRGPEQFTRMQEALARLELTDGLSLAELLLEVTPRLPRDATVIAVVPSAGAEVVTVLGGLRQQGYAVTAIVLELDDYDFAESAGRLSGVGIETRQVRDEASLGALCDSQLAR